MLLLSPLGIIQDHPDRHECETRWMDNYYFLRRISIIPRFTQSIRH